MRNDEPVDFDGAFYRLRRAVLLPKPMQPGSPPILIGGNGPHRTLSLVARYADEWNAVYIPTDRISELSLRLDAMLQKRGRQPTAVHRSLMTGLVFGTDQTRFASRLDGRDSRALRDRGLIVGTQSDVVEQLGQLADLGLYRVMLQWLDLDDLDGLEGLARTILPQL